jgi:hypothetical protein
MHFEGEFRVPGAADAVIRRFADIPRMARCMPGAVLEKQAEDGSWPGAMVVSFGPKKINFKGRVTCEFDFAAKTGSLHGRGTADMRAARIGVKVAFALRDDDVATTPTTIVRVTSDAELGGVLADFARTGGVAVATVIMEDFARRAAQEFAHDDAVAAVPTAMAPPAAAADTAAPAQAAGAPAAAAAASASASAAGSTTPASTAANTPASHATHSAAPSPAAAPPATAAAPPAASARATAPPPRAASQPAAAPATLSATRLFWAVLRLKLRHLLRRLGRRAKGSA